MEQSNAVELVGPTFLEHAIHVLRDHPRVAGRKERLELSGITLRVLVDVNPQVIVQEPGPRVAFLRGQDDRGARRDDIPSLPRREWIEHWEMRRATRWRRFTKLGDGQCGRRKGRLEFDGTDGRARSSRSDRWVAHGCLYRQASPKCFGSMTCVWYRHRMEPASVGKLLIALGLGVAALGVVVWAAQSLPENLRPFHLPGDIRIEREGFRFYFPITTMILLSLAATGLMALIRWWRG